MEPDGAEETNEDDRPAGRVAIAERLSGVSRADMAQDMVSVFNKDTKRTRHKEYKVSTKDRCSVETIHKLGCSSVSIARVLVMAVAMLEAGCGYAPQRLIAVRFQLSTCAATCARRHAVLTAAHINIQESGTKHTSSGECTHNSAGA